MVDKKFFDQRKKDSVEIKHIFPHHTNTYTLLKDLIKLIDRNHFVNSCSICELLQRALLKRKYIRADDVCNARVRVKVIIE